MYMALVPNMFILFFYLDKNRHILDVGVFCGFKPVLIVMTESFVYFGLCISFLFKSNYCYFSSWVGFVAQRFY